MRAKHRKRKIRDQILRKYWQNRFKLDGSLHIFSTKTQQLIKVYQEEEYL